MIEPGGIPQYTGDFGQLEKAASSLRTHATGIRTGGKDVHSRFQATAAFYKAPEADKLFSSTQPVMDTAEEFAGNIESLADALDTFIYEAKPHADRLKQLRLDAIDFVDGVRGDDDWTEDKNKTDQHQALMDGVDAARAAFQEAERNAANKINAISPAVCRPAWIVDDGTHGLGMYGQNAGALKDMKDLPWGSPEGRTYERWSLEWWGHGAKSWAWDGLVKDSIGGGIDGLITLVGFHGGEARDQAWDGLRRTVVGGYAYGMDLFGQDEHLSDWQRDSKPYAKEFGKQFIAYDMANEDPARAHAVVSFNLLTLATGPLCRRREARQGRHDREGRRHHGEDRRRPRPTLRHVQGRQGAFGSAQGLPGLGQRQRPPPDTEDQVPRRCVRPRQSLPGRQGRQVRPPRPRRQTQPGSGQARTFRRRTGRRPTTQ
ncbi:hypothetical protein OHU11_19870 [Streptomyces sp. NBC_00257]|uniref:hypothetical protein n=1 Tax=unclassified Streptomyces TaxID=2593676 RepID=UPI00225BC3CD|nr:MULTISPECIES: hypothetical protein [unclassified Streptomyces]MCX5429932.1 hypothetical protein [Streptomyces sp. NBC_00062]